MWVSNERQIENKTYRRYIPKLYTYILIPKRIKLETDSLKKSVG